MNDWQWVDISDGHGWCARGFLLDGRRQGLWLEKVERCGARVALYVDGIALEEFQDTTAGMRERISLDDER